MKFTLSTHIFSALALFAVLAPAAHAVPLNYTVSGGMVDVNSQDPGLVIHADVSPALPNFSFVLDDGGSQGFNFFDIWTNETSINPDDTHSMPISANLNFSDPNTGVTVNGITVGGSLIFGIAQWGQVTWDGPVTVDVGDRSFTVALTNEIFNFGIFGLSPGPCYGATVEAIVTQDSSTASPSSPVPDSGGTLLLSGLSFAGLFFIRRRQLASRS